TNVVHLPQRRFWRTAGLSAIAAGILCLLAWQFWNPQRKESFSVAQAEKQETIAPMSPLGVPETKKSEPLYVAPAKQPPPASPAPARTRVPAGARFAEDSASGYNVPKDQIEFLAQFGSAAEAIANHSYVQEPAASRERSVELARTHNTGMANGHGGGPSYYYDTIVTPPPVQALPLTGDGRSLHPVPPGVRTESPLYQWKNQDSGERGAKKELQAAEGELQELRKSYLDNHPFVKTQRKKVEALRLQVSKGTAQYPKYTENKFESVLQNPLSTFSIDVDTASYANVRRFLSQGVLPPADAVRIEEMINYFSYDYPQPKGDEPFSVNMEVADCPWQPEHRLLRIGLKGKEMAQEKRPPSNFVFLIDVSGSMSPRERLPLIKQSLQMLVKRMTENDRVAIVVYAGSSGVVLESTPAVHKEKILEALDRLEAGGSTNGGQGIQRAYALAEENFIKEGVNRVILCTDGDFNVGITNQEELINLIQRKAKSGVFLSVLGVGTDNYKDALMQKLANKGNGNYHYIDSLEEAHKVLVQQMNSTLVTIAKDVKIQIEFNPAQVSSYRLIGYEKRVLAAEDFNNDKKDAGEIGAGHTVTALYEIVPAGKQNAQLTAAVDKLKYQREVTPATVPRRELAGNKNEMLTLKLRYKKPDGETSVLREHTLVDQERKLSQVSTDFRFAAAVASFGMLLKDSEHKGDANFGSVLKLAREAKGDDKEGYRAEFINLVKKAKELSE
ncbi:MAG: von Willebrand factor type A domain-containing protein, partial [Limisphaerales bacterium]